MKANHTQTENQAFPYNPETGEIIEDDQRMNAPQEAASELYGGEGSQPDGSTIVKTLTMANIRGNPERAKIMNKPVKIALVTGVAGNEYLMPPMDQQSHFESLPLDDIERMTFTALVAALEPWGCVRYGDDAEPDAIFRSDYLFMPTYHNTVVKRRRQLGQLAIAYEIWAQPAGNKAGYSWFLNDLAKYNPAQLGYVDRLMKLGVQAGRDLLLNKTSHGLLADLRK